MAKEVDQKFQSLFDSFQDGTYLSSHYSFKGPDYLVKGYFHLQPDSEVYSLTGLYPLSLWKLVDFLKEVYNVRDKHTLSVASMVVLYRMKMYHNTENKVLACHFCVSDKVVSIIFWMISLFNFTGTNASIKVWSRELTMAQKNLLYGQMHERMDVLYQVLASRIADPAGKNRGTYFEFLALVIMASQALQWQCDDCDGIFMFSLQTSSARRCSSGLH